MHGNATPSPSPMTARATSSGAKPPLVAANGVATVASYQTAIPAPSTTFPPYLSANIPPTSGVSAYPHRNELCTNPTARSPHPFAAASGTPATAMITRSALHSISANATSDTTTIRYLVVVVSSSRVVAAFALAFALARVVPRRAAVSRASFAAVPVVARASELSRLAPRAVVVRARASLARRRAVSPLRLVVARARVASVARVAGVATRVAVVGVIASRARRASPCRVAAPRRASDVANRIRLARPHTRARDERARDDARSPRVDLYRRARRATRRIAEARRSARAEA